MQAAILNFTDYSANLQLQSSQNSSSVQHQPEQTAAPKKSFDTLVKEARTAEEDAKPDSKAPVKEDSKDSETAVNRPVSDEGNNENRQKTGDADHSLRQAARITHADEKDLKSSEIRKNTKKNLKTEKNTEKQETAGVEIAEKQNAAAFVQLPPDSASSDDINLLPDYGSEISDVQEESRSVQVSVSAEPHAAFAEKFSGDLKENSKKKPDGSRRFALDKDGKIIVTDMRNKQEIKAEKSVKESKSADFVTEVRYDGRNSAEMTLNLAENIQQNLLSSNGQTASSFGSDFQAMLTNQIQQNAGDFVKAGSIVLKDNDVGSIKLVLHPESLGNVKIDLQISDKVITGRITVASQEAYNAFKESADSLKQAFMQSGFDSAGFDLSMAGQNASSGNNFAEQQNDSAARYGMIKSYGGFTSDGQSEVSDQTAAGLLSAHSAINIVA